MPNPRGLFIVLEGADGSGKTTQFNLLTERLRAVGYDVEIFDFPRYDQNSSHFVKKYLNGEYGPASNINPYTASLFYALDRYEAASEIRKALEAGKIVLSNRYVGSNMAHQGSKFSSEAEQRGFFVWNDSLEFQLLGIPRPNLNIFLRVPAEISFKLVGRKARRAYTAKPRDEHEADLQHLQRAVATYDSMCRLFPRDFIAIDCVQGGRLLSILTINERIWRLILPLLSEDIPRHAPKAKTIRLDKPPQTNKTQPTPISKKRQPEDKKSAIDIKDASLLSLRKLAIYDQSTAATEQQDKSKKTNYYVPANLSPKTLSKYNKTMVFVYETRRKIMLSLKEKKLLTNPTAHWAIQMLRPMAELTSSNYHLSRAGLDKLAQELLRGNMIELKEIANRIPRGLLPATASIAGNKSETVISFNRALGSLAPDHSIAYQPATLNSFQPRAEFEMLADILFEFSGLSKNEITQAVSSWDYTRKASVLKSVLGTTRFSNPAVLGKLNYEWDLLLDGPSVEYLSAAGALGQVKAQPASPRYGYETPRVIDEAGLDNLYTSCYDASLELYSELQATKQHDEAQYAVLYGHKQRYQVTTSYLQLKVVWASSTGNSAPEGLKPVADAIIESVSTAHPLISASFSADTPLSKPDSFRNKDKEMPKRTKDVLGKKAAGHSKKIVQKTRRKSR